MQTATDKKVQGLSRGAKLVKDYKYFFYVIPVLVGVALFTLVPMIVSLGYSFSDYDFTKAENQITQFTFRNYQRMFTDKDLGYSLFITFRYSIVTVVLSMVGSYALALFLNQKLKVIPALRVIYYLPSLIPAIAGTLLWKNILDADTGYLNLIFAQLGLPKYTFYQLKESVFPTILFTSLFGWGGGTIMWLAQMKNIPVQEIIFGDGIAYIGNMSFYGCVALGNIDLPDSLECIKSNVFNDTKMYNDAANDSVFIVDGWVMCYKNGYGGTVKVKGELVFPDNTIGIADSAFSGVWHSNISGVSIVIGSNIKYIGASAFRNNNKIISIVIGDAVEYIGESAFRDNNSPTVIMGSSVKAIGAYAFLGANISSTILPDSLLKIGDGAFSSCGTVSSVTIPSSVIYIGGEAFLYTNIKTLIFSGLTPPQAGNSVYNQPIFSGMNTIYVPNSALNAYKYSNYWSAYTDIMTGY